MAQPWKSTGPGQFIIPDPQSMIGFSGQGGEGIAKAEERKVKSKRCIIILKFSVFLRLVKSFLPTDYMIFNTLVPRLLSIIGAYRVNFHGTSVQALSS